MGYAKPAVDFSRTVSCLDHWAKHKDKVENALKASVCARTLTLHEAQQTIATDWFKYYRDHILK